ncbi:M56 family metallopeptidase [Desulfuribacillus alkaliarsenatis]|uniref:Peptidase M56 domain-containing protein n=1 Tax=Desulfuribacillus alkaliarsenatis TaxID=766136 RepID=A0A1E5G309_9FIRM|nr:M56 family metallopeptidase [Desulfuribacillus alkaliarsenatis]OEF97364.1 hypothetical protein BHF68_03910 [Desulfuribacillus alkaliarsenatis]
MDTLFLQVLNMSITASYVILFVIIARLFLKKLPKIFSYALWSVVLFRLVSPFSFESVFSLLPGNTQTFNTDIATSQAPRIDSGITVIDQAVNRALPAPAVEASVNPMQVWIALGEVIWIIGIVALLTYSIFTAIKLSNRLKAATHVYDNVYEMDWIKTPFIFSIISPKIYLPTGLSEKEKEYIIRHEQTHISRFDHVFKPVAFLVLSIHWFNPLVWVAFILMSEDMEMSCDESVIKQMGNGIKKDYSTSLLALSTGRRIIGGCPLAFGENNTKGRIMNVLHYKKPAFWVVIIVGILVVVMSFGLMSNPQDSSLTIEDYANKVIDERIEFLAGAYSIINREITRLEKVTSFDHILPSTVEIWRLEYRLQPDDINNVLLAGGMNEIDGWITEDESMGKPMLVFSYQGSKLQYLGMMRSGEADFTKISGQEMALQRFLEGKGILPRVTYSGNHIVVKFPLSSGETSQLLLSQPVLQGDEGMWCVERWMDGNGNLYYEMPNTDGFKADYYRELQERVDAGIDMSLLDPLQVALDFINNELGQRVTLDKLEPINNATIEDFYQTPESSYIGYISNFTVDEFTKSSFHLEQIEWLTLGDTDRLRELDIDPNYMMPNGFYIYQNPNSYPMFHQVTEETEYKIIDWGAEIYHKSVNMEQFIESLEQYSNYAPPYTVVTKDGYVISITEVYVP